MSGFVVLFRTLLKCSVCFVVAFHQNQCVGISWRVKRRKQKKFFIKSLNSIKSRYLRNRCRTMRSSDLATCVTYSSHALWPTGLSYHGIAGNKNRYMNNQDLSRVIDRNRELASFCPGDRLKQSITAWLNMISSWYTNQYLL